MCTLGYIFHLPASSLDFLDLLSPITTFFLSPSTSKYDGTGLQGRWKDFEQDNQVLPGCLYKEGAPVITCKAAQLVGQIPKTKLR